MGPKVQRSTEAFAKRRALTGASNARDTEHMWFTWILVFGLAHARESLRPTSAAELLIGTQTDVGVRVKTARVVAFNRRRLTEMFPVLAQMPDGVIERWILDRAAYVNTRQLALDGVRNTPIDYDATDRVVFHVAPGAGRGADLEVDGQIINLKASGNSVWNQVQTAEQRRWADLGRIHEVRNVHHASGLETFYVAAAEFLRHLEIQRAYDSRAATGRPALETVEALFLIDYGFDIIAADERLPAFVIGREGHFGRVVDLGLAPDPEIYSDHGLHQASYSGARIDFGGARTPNEARQAYDARLKRLGRERTREFVARASARLLRGDVPERPLLAPRASPHLLRGPPKLRHRFVEPRALGLYADSTALDFTGETRAMARLKTKLFAMAPAELEQWLAKRDDYALGELFASARGPLKIPLPEAAYHHGLRRGSSVHDEAAAAARLVIARFPSLREPVLTEARAALGRFASAPDFVRELLTIDETFEGLAEFVVDAAASRHPVFRDLATERVAHVLKLAAHYSPKVDVTNRLEWPTFCAENFER